MDVFTPVAFAANSRAVTGTTANVALTMPTTKRSVTMRVVNLGPNTAFINLGTSSAVEAATTDMPVLAGTVEVFEVNAAFTHLAAICASGETATLKINVGFGS